MQHREFKSRLRQLREATGLSQRALGAKASLTKEAIYLYEAGRRTPSIAVAARLATALGTTVADLLGEGVVIEDPIDAAVERIVNAAPDLTEQQVVDLRRVLGTGV